MSEIWMVFRLESDKADCKCDPVLICPCQDEEAAKAFVLWMEREKSEFIPEWRPLRDGTTLLYFVKGAQSNRSDYLIARSKSYSLADVLAFERSGTK